jgi:superfamily I DNA/RNA helicase
MHAAKGLEYPVVYIVGVEEGALPHMRSIEQNTKDEERRLFYVGITRAMQELTITWCHSRKRWGNIVPCQPSSFFKELDPDLCEQMTFEDLAAKPAAEDVAADYFARMKAMLSE